MNNYNVQVYTDKKNTSINWENFLDTRTYLNNYQVYIILSKKLL